MRRRAFQTDILRILKQATHYCSNGLLGFVLQTLIMLDAFFHTNLQCSHNNFLERVKESEHILMNTSLLPALILIIQILSKLTLSRPCISLVHERTSQNEMDNTSDTIERNNPWFAIGQKLADLCRPLSALSHVLERLIDTVDRSLRLVDYLITLDKTLLIWTFGTKCSPDMSRNGRRGTSAAISRRKCHKSLHSSTLNRWPCI